jgi:hypothetical protein
MTSLTCSHRDDSVATAVGTGPHLTRCLIVLQVKGKPDADTHRRSSQPLPDQSALSLKLACVQRRQLLVFDVKGGHCQKRNVR